MLLPVVFAGIKQPEKLACRPVHSRHVWALMCVAMQAREGKIVQDRLAAVLACNYVIKAKGFVRGRSDMAVLASRSGPLTDLSAKVAIHESRDFSATRAFDCRTARKFAM